MVETGNLSVLGILARASSVIAEGEVMQLRSANNLGTTEADYLAVVTAKTAALFAASAEAGGALAAAPRPIVETLRDYGLNLGIAFQLTDDTLDYLGGEQQMGKAVGDDFREAKVTLPVILALQRASEPQRRFWERVIEAGEQSDRDLETAIQIVRDTGAIGESLSKARRYADAAIAAASRLPSGQTSTALVNIAEFCVARTF